MAISPTSNLIIQVLFGFFYHLAFAIKFFVDIGRTNPNFCIYPCYGIARASSAYFIYMAFYILGYVFLNATGKLNRLHQNFATRTVAAILTIPVILTPIVYIALIYGASRKHACPGLEDAYHSWFVFFCVVVGIGIGLSFIALLLYICFYGSGYQVPGLNFAFGPVAIGGTPHAKGPQYSSV